jgi:thymidylate synthase ThyX
LKKREIYLLSPGQLSQETIAVTFAKTSRSPESFRDIAAGLTDQQSAAFHEKWVLGYGHASVAEHAVLHIAFENISRLAIETIESNRLASYTEKSTRYQKWSPEDYYLPQEIRGGPFEETFRALCETLFQTYLDSLEPVRAVVRERFPPKVDESEERWDARIRSKYVDACRYILPSAALANVGMTANARVLEHAISKMLSHPLHEVRAIGQTLRNEVGAEVPTLLRYASEKPILRPVMERLRPFLPGSPIHEYSEPSLRLLDYNPDSEEAVLAAAFLETGGRFSDHLERLKELDQAGKRELTRALLTPLGEHDAPPRSFEHATYQFEAVMDQGAYFEVKRHRMMTQTPGPLTASWGYVTPKLICEAGFEEPYQEAMDLAGETYQALAEWNPNVASYIIPNAFNRRLLMTMNLREAFHFCELRAAPNAHFSVRSIALEMAELISQVHPILASRMRLPEGVDAEQIRFNHFCQEL